MEDRNMAASCLRSEEEVEGLQWYSNVHEFLRRRLEDGKGGPCMLKAEGPLACSIQEQYFPSAESLCGATIDLYFDPQDGGEGRKATNQVKVRDMDEQQNLLGHLLCACARGNVPALHAVIDTGRHPDLNAPLRCDNNQELTPLSIAAVVGSCGCCTLLLQRGADITTVDRLGRCALHWAIIAGHVDVVRQLIKEGAPLSTLDQEGFSPVCLGALTGSKEIVDLILRQNPVPDIAHPSTGATPLMLACGRGNHGVTKAMLKRHADTNAKDRLGHSAIHCAVWGGNPSCVKSVHTSGSCAMSDSFGRTAFLLAASKGNVEMCNYFLSKGSSWSELDREGRNCIHWAVLSRTAECVSALLTRREVDRTLLCRQQDMRGATPLHYAATTGSVELLNMIIGECEDHSPADVCGWTPLLWAALCSHTSVVGRLLEAKVPVTCQVTCPESLQPLHAAASVGADEVCQLILQHGAEVDVEGPKKRTPLHCACRYGHVGCAHLLISSGAKVNCLTEELQAPLHSAASHGYTDILCQLLAAGASKDMTCPPNGESPAHLAARNGRTSALEALLNNGCDVDSVRTLDGRTLLHLASMGGQLECCQLLVQRGANTSLRDNTIERCTALDLAMLCAHWSCSVFLMSVHVPSGGGRYHRAALTIQAVWRFSRHKRRKHITRQWAAMVVQRAFRSVRLLRKAQRLRKVRERARNTAASVIQHHWRSYIREKRRYEATYARLRARLQQERAAAGIIMHELNSQTHSVQLPSTASRQKLATSVSKFLLQAAAQPSVAMASGAIVFPREAPKPELGVRSRTIPPPASVTPISDITRVNASAIKEGTWSGEEERHHEVHSDNAATSPKLEHPDPSPKVGCPGPSPKAGCPGHSPKVGYPGSSPKTGHPGPSPRIRHFPSPPPHKEVLKDTTKGGAPARVVPRPNAQQGAAGLLPHLPVTTSLVASRSNGSPQRAPNGDLYEPPSKSATIKMRHSVPLGVRSPSKASQTEQGQVSTSPSQRALGAGRSSTVKGSSYVQKQKGAWKGVEQEVLTTAQRYSELNKILYALKQAQASPSLTTELNTGDLKEHIRTTLNEAVRLRADTEVLQSRLNDSTSDWVTS